jgi:hypothetical protein
VIETHISWVFRYATDVLKVKKPVDFGFLDFTTRDARREACEAEVRLNRRLAPDVYLGVVPITRSSEGRHAVDGPGEIVDYAVHMRRLDDADRADHRLEAGSLSHEDVERVAQRIARFHAEAHRDERVARCGGLDVIRRNITENFEQTAKHLDTYLDHAQALELRSAQLAFLDDHASLFEARVPHAIVEGHGDLRLEHVYLTADDLRVLDCIEFNERFRHGDVAADVAFFAMDLTHHRRADLAEHFVSSYARAANDFDLYALIDFYESYRALVRGKIAAFVSADEGATFEVRERAAREARQYFVLALASARRPVLGPRLIAVGGIIGTGKSTIAEELRRMLGAPIVDTDRTRKHMLGVAATDRVYRGAWSDAYDPGFTDRVYDEVLSRASVVLESGRPVVVDASFRSRAARSRVADLAAERGVPFSFVECQAPLDVCRERLEARAQRTDAVSDGRVEILDDFVARWEPVDEVPAVQHVVLDTARPLLATRETLRTCFPSWPPALG